MALPSIASYPMPSELELPQNRASWGVDAARSALLVHDMQNYFLAPFQPGQAPVKELVENVARLVEQARSLEVPIFYSAQPGDQSAEARGLLADFWGPGLSAKPAHQDLAAELKARPGENEILITKHRYSAFQRTPLLAELRARGRDQLVVTGVYAHLGCLLTACEAFMNDVQPFFVYDAVADFTPELHAFALKYAAERCAVTLSTASIVESWGEAKSTLEGDVWALSIEVSELLEEPSAAIEPEESLLDRGLDSVRLMVMVDRLQQRGADVTFGDLAERPTLAAWAELVRTRRTCP
jgi:bifunctional isochorismate lyase/aryl carrier protein